MLWLTLMSIGGSAVAIVIDESVFELNRVKQWYRDNYWIWVAVALVCVAIALVMTQLVSKEAEGSGIP